jgi:hypothetical protein
MGLTDVERRALKGGAALPRQCAPPKQIAPPPIAPIAVRLPEAQRVSGLSRSDLYRRAARGEIIFLKSGSSVLVDFESLRNAVCRLPKARINIKA